MSQRPRPEVDEFERSLHRDEEEDLVDYGESDVENETGDNQKTSVAEGIEEIDIFADDTTQFEDAGQKDEARADTEELAKEAAGTTASKSTPTTTKTLEYAAVIKNLNDLLTDSTFRSALGLVEAGNTIDLGFWADGLEFALSLKLIGTAEVKACKFGAECRNKKCTFDHGDADRTALLTTSKPRKLCSMINTPTGCLKGDACWFSHEAFDVACADGELRATCVKGIYCVYKHSDDEVVATIEHIEQPHAQVEEVEKANESEVPSQNAPSVETAAEIKTESVPPIPASSTIASPKPQACGGKRRRGSEDENEDRPEKIQRVDKRQTCQERPDGRRDPSRARGESDNPSQGRQGSGQPQREFREHGSRGCGRKGRRGGRGGRGVRGNIYRPTEGRRRDGQDQKKKKLLEKRMSRA